MRSRLVIVFFLFAAIAAVTPAFAQRLINKATPGPELNLPSADKLFHAAKVRMDTIALLDQARVIKSMDATADGAHWYVVDEFAHWQSITIDGHRVARQFHEIPSSGTRLSPNGDYMVWTGQMHAFTTEGFDSTTTYLYHDTSLVDRYLSEYPSIEFSRSGERWAALLPYANEMQKGDRDFVVVDGLLRRKNYVLPHQFSFSHDEQHWAYRSTDGLNERFITDQSDTAITLYRRPPTTNTVWDPTIWRYTPDVSYYHKQLEGRDYDFDFEHVAKVYHTAYSSLAADTARFYVNYKEKNQGMHRWISDVLIDDSGKHIVYFAADPAIKVRTPTTHERSAVVVYDGKIIGGPFPGSSRLFLSPSGEHVAYSLDVPSAKFFLDKKVFAHTSAILDAVWSGDEKKLAFVALGEHGKTFVVANGKRSPLFEEIGRIAFTKDGRAIQFVGIQNGRVIHVMQSL